MAAETRRVTFAAAGAPRLSGVLHLEGDPEPFPWHPASRFVHLASHLLHLASCVLLLTSCLPIALTPTPSPTATVCPQPTESRPALPTASPTPPPATPLLPDQALALRPEFVADLDLLADAPRYHIELTVDLDAATLTGHQHVVYTNTEDVSLGALYLRLFPSTPGYGGVMTATSVLLDGRQVAPTVELQGSALRLPLDPPLEPGAARAVTLDFTLLVPTDSNQDATSSQKGYRQLGYYEGVLALANAYPLIPVYDNEGWNVELVPPYGDAVYSETAFYTVRLTAPVDLTLVASGSCTLSQPSPGGSRTWTCVTGPMRDFNAILGADYRMESRAVEGVTVNSIFYTGHQQQGERALDYAAAALRLLSTRVGPYPFTELDVVETPTLAGGIEYPGLVVINTSYYEAPNERMEWVVVHEVAHQWWYSLVGNDQVDEPWLDEALTQYNTLLYYEDRYGPERASELVEYVFRRPYQELVDSGHDAPAGLPIAAYSLDDYGPVVYDKGPLYFHELRQKVGDEAFWAILRMYFTRHRYGLATPEDWLAAVEAISGDAHRALYERWIAGTVER